MSAATAVRVVPLRVPVRNETVREPEEPEVADCYPDAVYGATTEALRRGWLAELCRRRG